MKNRLRALLSLLACVFTAIMAVAQPAGKDAVPSLSHPAFESRSVLFEGGDGVSKFYRIPALATLPNGTLVALADRRLENNDDLPGKIDVVCRRSTDGGRTWGPTIVVAEHDTILGGYGDPAVGVAKDGTVVAVFTHGLGLRNAGPGQYARICVSRSRDGGLTWSKPEDITPNLYAQEAGKAPVQCITAFATSGRILTDSRGQMWFALITKPNKGNWTLGCYAVVSNDNGRTWHSLPANIDANADESKFVETAKDEIMISIRNKARNGRKFATTKDNGRTWSALRTAPSLPDPACNGDIVSLPDGTLIHSIPASNTQRRDVSIYASRDKGLTWKQIALVCPVGSAYSALTLMDGGKTLGVLTEEASSLGGFRLWFTRLNLDMLLKK